jgi:hypothetical protein
MKREEVNSCTYPVDDLLTTNYIFEPIRFLYILLADSSLHFQ